MENCPDLKLAWSKTAYSVQFNTVPINNRSHARPACGFAYESQFDETHSSTIQ